MSPAMRIIAFFTGLVPVSCHVTVTGPLLWAHNSSTAFEVWVGFWICGLIFLACCWYAAWTGKS